MTLDNKWPLPDLANIEHNDDAEAKNVVMLGKTTSGAYVPIKVDTDGSIMANYLKLDGSNANQNIDIGIYDFLATNIDITGNYKINGVILDSDDIPDHNGHTVHDTFNHLLNRGKSFAITVSLTGGLGIGWTTGEIYDEANNLFIATTLGSGNLTDNSPNYLKWVSGTGLTLSTSISDNDEILIAIFSVYDGVINSYRETSIMSESVANTRRGLREIIPVRIISGMSVSEDTDVTNALDVTMDAGVFWCCGIEKSTPIEIKSRNTAMVRHFHTGGVWDYDTNAEIDTANYDNGTAKTTIPVNKWVKALFLYMNGKIGWVYPNAYYNTEAQAIVAPLPTIPPGLASIPKLTAIVYKQGDANFTNTTWQDVRAGISEVSFTGVDDHGSLVGLGDNDHPQYFLVDGQSANIVNGTFDFTTTGSGTFGNLDVDDLNLNGNVISSSSDLNLTTLGKINLSVGAAERVYVTPDLDVEYDLYVGAEATVDDLIITAPANTDYKFTSSIIGSALGLVSQISGQSSRIDYFTKDGDGTDSAMTRYYSKGTHDDATNSEFMQVAMLSGARGRIHTFATGTGTTPTLELFTDLNTGQLLLNTDGTSDFGGDLTVATNIKSATLEIENNANAQLLTLDQNYSTAAFVDFQGTYSSVVGANNNSRGDGAGAITGPHRGLEGKGWRWTGMVKIEVSGASYWMPYYDDEDDAPE